MEKQIEEMAKVLGEIQEFGINRPRDEERYPVLYPSNKEVADYLISKGYRKYTDVAREIFAEIERLLDNHHSACLPVGAIEAYTYYEGGLGDSIAELKKKYESEGKKDNGNDNK
jgi:hypothetical protein